MPILGSNSSGGSRPSAPVIGSATDGGTGTTASVDFTSSTYIGKGTINYTVTSSPGNFTASGSSSPVTVSGLTAGTAYTFTVQGTTNYGITSAVSSASNSLTPVTPSSFESIATVSGTGSSGTITFSSIPATYKHLQIRYIGKTTQTDTDVYSANLSLNGSSTSYSRNRIQGGELTITAQGQTGLGSIAFPNVIPPSAGFATDIHGVGIIDILDYASTSKAKTVTALVAEDTNRTTFPGGYMNLVEGLWFATPAAVNSISIVVSGSGSWTTTSSFALYGIKG